MAIYLGLDIGSNSVGSSWVDTERKKIVVGVSVFPAGVDETDDKRGAPKNQDRRSKRSLRRSIARRSLRKRLLRQHLLKLDLLPNDPSLLQALFDKDPWELRRRALIEPVTPHEFGRILVHIIQRRGALGLKLQSALESKADSIEEKKQEPADEAKVKSAVEHTRKEMKQRGARTYGEMIAMVAQERSSPVLNSDGTQRQVAGNQSSVVTFQEKPVRNRLDSFEFHADRTLIREEFELLWQTQSSFDGPLKAYLTDEFRVALDDPTQDHIWRHKGLLFGQRRTYWNVGTLGRCDLEPTDRCVPIADRHASHYRVIETVNNIRLRGPGDADFRPLTATERAKVIAKLRSQGTGTIAAVRGALGINKQSLKKLDIPETAYSLNLERDEEREINTDWFYRAIVDGGIGLDNWNSMTERQREAVNRAILRFDPAVDGDDDQLRQVATKWRFDIATIERLVEAWLGRPKLEKRLQLSRRAVINLLPYMERQLPDGRWPTQIEARRMFAEDTGAIDQTNHSSPTPQQRRRYQLGTAPRTKAERHFLKKHPDSLPPAPTLSNPVVRKAVHEVRRHLIAYLREFKRKPDRIVIEFAREASKPAKESDRILQLNINREKTRKRIIKEFVKPAFGGRFVALSHNQIRAATDRVLLCEQQKSTCAYSGTSITPFQAASGTDLEVDHIIPYSRSGDNSLNNRVLCFRKSNRDKQNKTPREWWGAEFDRHSNPMRFMDGFQPERGGYFTKQDYAAKWRNFSCASVPEQWRGSQLTDTAYAAREVQEYLQHALWPDEDGENAMTETGKRRIFVTKGRYTALLRKDWQLYKKLLAASGATTQEINHARAKNRGDHREHAIDAVAIAFTDPARIGDLAQHVRLAEEARAKALAQGHDAYSTKRQPLPVPWGNVQSFREQVLSLVFDDFDDAGERSKSSDGTAPIVVCHRPVKRKLIGRLHDDQPFGIVQGEENQFTKRIKIEGLKPEHLRLRVAEKPDVAIRELAKDLLEQSAATTLKAARERAKSIVNARDYRPKMIDPPPKKAGLVRDFETRRVLRSEIEARLSKLGITRTVEDFTSSDLNRMLKLGPFRWPSSGVPIRRLILLRTIKDPVVVSGPDWGGCSIKSSKIEDSCRAYNSGNNHHIEIRENSKGAWTGDIIRMFDAASRVRRENIDAINRTNHPKDGRFVMSLAEGEIVYMRHKDTKIPDYFVVFELEKPQSILFKYHWDARRAKGEKNEFGEVFDESKRFEMNVSVIDLKALAPPGEVTPIKVEVDRLGRVKRIEPFFADNSDVSNIDARVMQVAREALDARAKDKGDHIETSRRQKVGSWNWMRGQLARQGIADLAPQLTRAFAALQSESDETK